MKKIFLVVAVLAVLMVFSLVAEILLSAFAKTNLSHLFLFVAGGILLILIIVIVLGYVFTIRNSKKDKK